MKLFLALCACLISAIQSMATTSLIRVDGLSESSFESSGISYSLRLYSVENQNNFPEDVLGLMLFNAAGDEVFDYRYNSSYGYVNLEILDIDSDNKVEFFLRYKDGRGTSVTKERLKIFNFRHGALTEILDIPLSGYASMGVQWHYDLSFNYENQSLDLKLNTPETTILYDKNLVPSVERLVVKFGDGRIDVIGGGKR